MKKAIALLLLTALSLLCGVSRAQDYPVRPIRVLIPFPPGGGSDIASRVILELVARNTDLQFVAENRAGAGGNIAFVKEGDSITIDAHKLLLQLNISDEELAQRKAGWTPPAPRYTRGVQAKFAFNAASASKGAVLDNY